MLSLWVLLALPRPKCKPMISLPSSERRLHPYYGGLETALTVS